MEKFTLGKQTIQWWISYFKMIGASLYNITNGGEGTSGRKHSVETRKKISDANKGKQNRLGQINSPKHRENISQSLAGKNYSFDRKKQWYTSYYGSNIPNGLSGKEKERNSKSEAHKGSKNGRAAKLNEEQVLQIKKLIREGLSTRSLAKTFGVSKSAIADISRGRCWSHVMIT